MKRSLALIVLCIAFLCGSQVFAEETDNTEYDDSVFDLSEEQELIEELGIPTVSSVDELLNEATSLWEKKEYEEAADVYASLAQQSNWLANILSSALEPYYSADYEDREEFAPEILNVGELAVYEALSNSYKTTRNQAMLYEGLCYYYLSDYETALPLLIKSLDIIEIDDEENWKLGLQALYSIIGLSSDTD